MQDPLVQWGDGDLERLPPRSKLLGEPALSGRFIEKGLVSPGFPAGLQLLLGQGGAAHRPHTANSPPSAVNAPEAIKAKPAYRIRASGCRCCHQR